MAPDDKRLHAGLRRTVNVTLDTDERWGFRLIASSHGNRVLRKLREARDSAVDRVLYEVGGAWIVWSGR